FFMICSSVNLTNNKPFHTCSYLVESRGPTETVERRFEQESSGDVEDFLDVVENSRCGRGRQAEYRHRGKLALHDAQKFVVWGRNIVAPLGAAVNLINDDPRQAPETVAFLQAVHEALALGQFLGRHVQKFQPGALIHHLIL
ncbi:hypothetical protein EGW08_002342, partial [Elysia chlorotica]